MVIAKKVVLRCRSLLPGNPFGAYAYTKKNIKKNLFIFVLL